MRFNWRKFCDTNHVPYVTEGPNTARGRISIRCPFCGNADPSQHMGLSLTERDPVWGCLRNARHRGRDPARLVMVLLGIGYVHALVLVQSAGPRLDEYDRIIEQFREQQNAKPEPPAEPRREMPLPREFRRLTDGPYAGKFVSYLAQSRGFGRRDAEEIAETYELYYALTGDQSWRLIFPLRSGGGKLLGWQGRAVRPARARYLTSPGLPESALLAFRPENAVAPVLARPIERIALVEGPLDALKLDFYGRTYGVRAVASMGTAPARARISAIRALSVRSLFVAFDSDAFSQALAFCEELPGSRWVPLPDGVKDPGEMTPAQARDFSFRLSELS